MQIISRSLSPSASCMWFFMVELLLGFLIPLTQSTSQLSLFLTLILCLPTFLLNVIDTLLPHFRCHSGISKMPLFVTGRALTFELCAHMTDMKVWHPLKWRRSLSITNLNIVHWNFAFILNLNDDFCPNCIIDFIILCNGLCLLPNVVLDGWMARCTAFALYLHLYPKIWIISYKFSKEIQITN